MEDGAEGQGDDAEATRGRLPDRAEEVSAPRVRADGQLGSEDYRALYENSPDGALFTAPDGRVLAANPAACKILGRTEQEICRIGRQAMMDHDDERWPHLLDERDRTGQVHGIARMIRGDGVKIDVEMSALVFTDRHQQLRTCTVIRDVTERLRAELRLAVSMSRFETLFDAAPTSTLLLDRQYRISAANQAAEVLLGRPREDLIGRSMLELLHPEDRIPSAERLERLWRREVAAIRCEKRYINALGHTVWAQVEKSLISSENGDEAFVLEQAQDITVRRRHEEDLEHLATHDSLTGLLNRRGLFAELERQAATAQRYGAAGALLVIDLDHFKYVNDSLGHRAGDELLVTVADLIRERVRETDIVARLGGDEFAVLLPRGPLEAAESVAESIVTALADDPRMDPAGGLPVTASVGVAEFLNDLNAEEVMQSADLAMYDAKDAGRNQVACYRQDDRDRPRTEARIKWIERIRKALATDGFVLFSQPIVDVETGRPLMHELLLRMPDEHGGLTAPAAFLYIAERYDLIQEIDRWVITQAANAIGIATTQGQPLHLAVNLSSKSLSAPDLLDYIAAEMRRNHADPQQLLFEITETAAVAHVNSARRFAQRARDLGCRIAIDDFGAGFGSFYYLKNLPIDYLKIDGEFVQGAPYNPADALIVETIRDLARGLGHEVIAEHCADEQTEQWLIEHDITLHQGYHHAPPRPLTHPSSGLGTNEGSS